MMRHTAKALVIVEHEKYGPCALLTKERDGSYGLPGGGIDTGELPEQALVREIQEELGEQCVIVQYSPYLVVDNTSTSQQIHHIFSTQIQGTLSVDLEELQGLGVYPLDKKFAQERKAIESRMFGHAYRILHEYPYEAGVQPLLSHIDDDGDYVFAINIFAQELCALLCEEKKNNK